MKKTCSVYVSKNNFGLKFVQTVLLKIDNFKNTKIIFGAVNGILVVSHQILFCHLSSSRQIKTKISLSFHHEEKNLWWKRLVLCTLVFPKILLVWNLFTILFLKLTILKTLKLFLALSGAWWDTCISHQILVFRYLSSLAKSTNKTKIFTSLFIMKKKFVMKKTCSVYLTNVSKNNFGLKFVQTNFSVFKIDNFKNTKIIFGAQGAWWDT